MQTTRQLPHRGVRVSRLPSVDGVPIIQEPGRQLDAFAPEHAVAANTSSVASDGADSSSASLSNHQGPTTPGSTECSGSSVRGRDSLSPLRQRGLYNASPSPTPQARARVDALPDMTEIEDILTELDISSGEDDSEDENIASVHNIRSEPLPRTRFHNGRFQDALKDTRSMLDQMTKTMRASPIIERGSSTLGQLFRQIKALSTWESSATRKVALVGDAGAGKSSLINSLLNRKGLALSGSSGSACTCVVTEYRYQDRSHLAPYRMEVEFTSVEDVQAMVQDLCRRYRERHSELYEQLDSQQDKDESDRAATSALDMFRIIFRDRPSLTEDFLKQRELKVVSECLRTWTTAAHSRLPCTVNNTWSGEANSAEECQAELDRFIRDPETEGEPGLWPFVHVVRVYLHAEILKSGVILADLPGLRDLNRVRLKATENYVYNCNEVFAVVGIDRAITNDGIQDVIQRFGDRKAIRIVCTRSEDVKVEEELKICSASDAEELTLLQGKEKQFKQRCRKIKCKLGTNCLFQDKKVRLWEAHNKLQLNVDEFEFKLKLKLMTLRNARVSSQLLKKYQKKVKQGDLKVFCVSNRDYFDYQHTTSLWAESYRELSNIKSVRWWCLGLVSEANFFAGCAYLNDVATCLESIKLWVASGDINFDKEILDKLCNLLNAVEDGLRQDISLPASGLGQLEQRIRQDCRGLNRFMIQKDPTWTQYGVAVGHGWGKSMLWNSYQAFCRKGGIHAISGCAVRNWNDELLAQPMNDMKPNWNKLIEDIEDGTDATVRFANDTFQRAADPIEELAAEYYDTVPESLGIVIPSLRRRKIQYEDITFPTIKELQRVVWNIRRKASTGQASSFIVALMEPTYDACTIERGNGMFSRMRDIVEKRLGGGQLWAEFRQMIAADLTRVVDSHMEKIKSDLSAVIDEVARDFDMIRNVEIAESDEDREFASRLKDAVENAVEMINRCQQTADELRVEDFAVYSEEDVYMDG